MCRISLLLKIQHVKFNKIGILFTGEWALENKYEGYDGKRAKGAA